MLAFITRQDLQNAVDMFLHGGWVMLMLGGVALVLYSTGLSAYIYISRGGLDLKRQNEWSRWIKDPSGAQGRAGEAIKYALHDGRPTVKSIRRRFLEIKSSILQTVDRRLLVVNTLTAAAPLAGLLGTVIGMLAMFAGLSQGSGKAGMDRVADGMQQALITTQTGLTIALPGLFLALIVRNRRNATERALARIESLIMTSQFSASELASARAASELQRKAA